MTVSWNRMFSKMNACTDRWMNTDDDMIRWASSRPVIAYQSVGTLPISPDESCKNTARQNSNKGKAEAYHNDLNNSAITIWQKLQWQKFAQGNWKNTSRLLYVLIIISSANKYIHESIHFNSPHYQYLLAIGNGSLAHYSRKQNEYDAQTTSQRGKATCFTSRIKSHW